MKCLMVLLVCLVAPVSAMAQRYGGTAQDGELGFRMSGGGVSGFEFFVTPTWNVELSVDESQNVTFHHLTFGFDGRLNFPGHGIGSVYADVNVVATTSQTLDLNPISFGDDAYLVRDFEIPMAVGGTYVNRGFENQFTGNYVANSYKQYALSFASFPDSLSFYELPGGFGRTEYSPTVDGPAVLEPFFDIRSMSLGSFHVAIQLLPIPPEPMNDISGDSNHDGRFDSGDLVAVFTAGQYEDSIAGNSTWETGDWNGDMEFDSGDFLSAFQAGGYVNEAVAIPEPVGTLIVAVGFLIAARRFGR